MQRQIQPLQVQPLIQRILRYRVIQHLPRSRRVRPHVVQEPRVLDRERRSYGLALGGRDVLLVQLDALVVVAAPPLEVHASVEYNVNV